MTINDSFEIGGFTVLILSESRPLTGWKALRVGEAVYEPLIMMDAADNVVAINGAHDLNGKTVEFI